MPKNSEYGGHGESVYNDMLNRYGSKNGEKIYYATMNAHPNLKSKKEKAHKGAVEKLAKGK